MTLATVTMRRLRKALLIGIACLVIYNANLRGISAGDTYPARYLPFSIVRYHTLVLNPIANVAAQGRNSDRMEGAFWLLPMPSGRIISLYPVVVPLVVSPLYVPAVAYLHWRGWSDVRFDYVAKLMEKLSASLVAALSAALLYVLLRRRTSERNALLLTCAFAFGTTTWMISSQALWQHGVGQLLVILTLLLLTSECSTPRAIAAGVLCALIACNRPPDIVLGAALGAYALYWAGRRRWPALIASASLPMIALLVYNFAFGGNIFGGYGVIGKAQFFSHPLFTGIAGLLISPTHGLLVFSPFFLFLVFAFRRSEERFLTLAMASAVVLQILLYAKVDWRAGLSWGPRYMTDLLPFLMLLLVPVVERLRGFGRATFITLIGVSIALEAIGAVTYTGGNDMPIYAIANGPRQMDAAFDWRNAPFLTSPKRGLAAPDLASVPRGNFDAIEIAGNDVAATGWALAGRRSPAQVVLMIDGRGAAATSTFTDRPDVVAVLHVASPSGWRIPIDTTQLTPGEHRVTAMVWMFGNGEGYYLAEKTLTVRSAPMVSPLATSGEADLNDAFTKAATRIRDHQQPEGFWLTAYTSGTRFTDARPEMNTFLTALMVDLLDPLRGSGLEPNVQRARAHLTKQIEPGGLVRYHGLPDAPWIGKLGCAITPDSDDTALVWRIAPAQDRRELDTVLATIDRYRTSDGLYRSWLAPREKFQCLDPGRDPNPTDIAIQMHLLMLLAKERPHQAHALCDALRRFIDDNRIWVYYRRTPLVPILRTNDLRDAGCDIALPESRMRTSVEGQAIWVTVARLLASEGGGGDGVRQPLRLSKQPLRLSKQPLRLSEQPSNVPRQPERLSYTSLLREIARNDFELIRTNPPLLYHNDLTATVARYYWSEDAGYALWLRLYQHYVHGHPR